MHHNFVSQKKKKINSWYHYWQSQHLSFPPVFYHLLSPHQAFPSHLNFLFTYSFISSLHLTIATFISSSDVHFFLLDTPGLLSLSLAISTSYLFILLFLLVVLLTLSLLSARASQLPIYLPFSSSLRILFLPRPRLLISPSHLTFPSSLPLAVLTFTPPDSSPGHPTSLLPPLHLLATPAASLSLPSLFLPFPCCPPLLPIFLSFRMYYLSVPSLFSVTPCLPCFS